MDKPTCNDPECERKVQARGMCATHYSYWYRANRKRTNTCQWCSETFQAARAEGKFCSRSCAGKNANSKVAESEAWAEHQARLQASKKPKREPRTQEQMQTLWRSQRSPLRAAYEDAQWDDFITHLKGRTNVTGEGCWVWSGRKSLSAKSSSPYPVIKWQKKSYQVHRLALEAKHGAPLGTQQAHHTCANTMCVNPEHLQPATHVENMAEMKARASYEARINELETALATVAPHHPLLSRINYGT